MSAAARATIVVAVEHGEANLPALIERLQPQTHADCDFIFCASDARALSSVPPDLPHVRTLVCAAGSRIPHMWRDAIVAARSEWVALLSVHCVPAAGWIVALLAQRFESDEAALGGYFTNDLQADARDWAIYLLRYAAFSRPVEQRSARHVAADNAAYRRSAVLACADLLEDGFWEVEYHERFRAKGMRLRLSADLEVVHVNRYSAREFAAQRREHGFAFGRDRARRLSGGRLVVYALAAPLIPAVLYAKVIARISRYRWWSAVPLGAYAWLAYFIAHWSWAEGHGLFHELSQRLPWTPIRRPSP